MYVQGMGEVYFSAIICSLLLGGEPEVRLPFSVGYDVNTVRIDCATNDSVVEVGMDKRSSLDSVQQALFASHLTGKAPVIYLVDTDGRIGKYETRIRAAAGMADVEFKTVTKDFLIRWQMTSWLRSYTPVAANPS